MDGDSIENIRPVMSYVLYPDPYKPEANNLKQKASRAMAQGYVEPQSMQR